MDARLHLSSSVLHAEGSTGSLVQEVVKVTSNAHGGIVSPLLTPQQQFTPRVTPQTQPRGVVSGSLSATSNAGFVSESPAFVNSGNSMQ